MLVKTKDGTWLNPARVAWVDEWWSGNQEGSRVYFSGRVDESDSHFNYDCTDCSETADELAALLNGAELAPRLVELPIESPMGGPALCLVDPRQIVAMGPEECDGETWITMWHDDTSYRVPLPYDECKRRLGLATETK